MTGLELMRSWGMAEARSGGDRHLFLDRPLHAGQADAEGVLDQLADRPDPAVAQVVDVVHGALALAQLEEVLDDLDVILGLEDLVLEGGLQARA